MTREHKVALLVGFSLVLVVCILVADHFSKASQARVNGDLASSRLQDYGTYVPEPAMPHPIPAGQGTDPLLVTAPEQAPPPSVFEMVMGVRPELTTSDLYEGFSSAGMAIRNGIAQLGLEHSAPAAQMNRAPLPPVDPQPRRDPLVADRAGAATGPASAPLPVSRGRLQRHEVGRGDTMTKIAERYYNEGRLWRQLQAYNASAVGADGTVRIGVTLLIPPRDVLLGEARLASDAQPLTAEAGRPAAAPPRQVEPPRQSTPPAPRPQPRTYTVRPGDTLQKIALAHLGTTRRWTEIRDLNKNQLSDHDSIRVGLVLALPSE